MTEVQTTEFIIGRLAELIVALLAQTSTEIKPDVLVREDSREILMTLGNWAAQHGRPDLMPILHGLAHKIDANARSQVEPFGEPPQSLSEKLVRRVNFRW